MAWVRKRKGRDGSARYLAGYTDPTGAQRSAGTFRNRSEAECAGHGAERRVGDGTWLDRSAGKVLFAEYVSQSWWPSLHHLELTTKAAYRSNLDAHFLPYFGGYPMSAITPSVVQGWVNQAVQHELSPRSIRKCHTLLHSLFKAAVRDRVIAYNPCEAITLPKVIKTRREPISPEQFEKLLAAIPAQHRALLQVGIETGMRWGELTPLGPRHLDPVNSRISVAETIVEISKKDSPTGQRYTVKPYPKNDQHRLIKITPELTAVLQLRIASLSLRSDEDVHAAPRSHNSAQAGSWSRNGPS